MKPKKTMKIVPIFLVGSGKSFFGEDKAEQEAKSNQILQKFGLSKEFKLLVRKEEEILGINIHGVDGFVIFPYCFERFSSLVYLAETKIPIIIFSEEKTFCHALDTYEYLCDRENVQVAFTSEEVKKKIRSIKAAKWFENMKICLFDAGEWKLDSIAWLKNPAVSGKFNIQNIDKEKLLKACKNVDTEKANNLAKRWMSESKVLEPSFDDVAKSASVYIAMKTIIKEMKADAAYILWCGQFTKTLETKMCFALAKLADDGIPVGCWRGENLLPLLILHSTSKKQSLFAKFKNAKERL